MPAPFHRDNHYVSRGYLKRWMRAEDKLWAYRALVSDARVPLWKRASMKGLAYHSHLYTRIVAPGETDEIERWFDAEFESPAEAAIQKAVSDAPLSPADWDRLIRFLAAQDVRTPARLMEMLKRWQNSLQPLVQETLESSVQEWQAAGRENRPIRRRSNADPEYLPIKITTETVPGEERGSLRLETVAGRGLWLFSLRHLLTRTVQALLKHRWTILRAPAGFFWVTSDDPVVRLNYHSAEKYDFKGGWGSHGTEIFLPLSPRHLLYTKIGSRPPQRGTVVTADVADRFQGFTIEHAHRFVFAMAPDSSVVERRPRLVDRTLFADEAELWNRWHAENTAAERALQV